MAIQSVLRDVFDELVEPAHGDERVGVITFRCQFLGDVTKQFDVVNAERHRDKRSKRRHRVGPPHFEKRQAEQSEGEENHHESAPGDRDRHRLARVELSGQGRPIFDGCLHQGGAIGRREAAEAQGRGHAVVQTVKLVQRNRTEKGRATREEHPAYRDQHHEQWQKAAR